MIKTLAALFLGIRKVILLYLAFILTYWILHIPVLCILGSIFGFDYNHAADVVNTIVYYPGQLVLHGPDALLYPGQKVPYNFWGTVFMPIIFGAFILWLLWVIIVIPVGLFNIVRKIINGRNQ